MSAANILLIASVIWIISMLNIFFVVRKQKVNKSELLNIRTLILAFFVAFSVAAISITISKL